MEALEISEAGHYTESAEGLLKFIQAAALPVLFHGFYGVNPQSLFPDITSDYESRVTKEHAQRIRKLLEESEWPAVRDDLMNALVKAYGQEEAEDKSDKDPKHSDAIVAVDQYGNVAAVCHSINTGAWGTTGIFVDGISIPDSACFQQQLIEAVGSGKPLPDPTNPLLIFKNGKPVLASSSIGSNLSSSTLQNLFNVLDFGMDPKKSVETANFHLISVNPAKRSVTKGDFSEEIIESVKELGEELQVVTAQAARGLLGYWVGIRIDPETGKLEGGVSKHINGLVLGY
jgi:gamma-glutamyltranspeptidase/glutathione hydrolase